jgi:hypothetical protein
MIALPEGERLSGAVPLHGPQRIGDDARLQRDQRVRDFERRRGRSADRALHGITHLDFRGTELTDDEAFGGASGAADEHQGDEEKTHRRSSSQTFGHPVA